jgi:alkylated DNA nucleotide flippase Atl1
MHVTETTIQLLLGGPKQFRVPLFQRTYTWKERDHAQLWRDIATQYELSRGGSSPDHGDAGHFIGSFVLAPAPAPATLPAYLVVDGQQRLTTLTLALCALRDAAVSRGDESAYERVTNQYLVNQYATDPLHRWKFMPTEDDRAEYFACIKADHAGSGNGLIAKAYRFFEIQMALPGPDDEPLDLDVLESVIVSKLAIVDITAQQGDNVHRIFESLNATGVGLTQADLLRNYVFMLLPTRDRTVYEEVWRPMQELLGAGNLEGLARVDLRRRGIDVRDDDVYRAQQARLQPIEHDEAAIEAQIRDLALRATHYRRILEPEHEPHPGVRRGLEFIARWRATTTHPFVMFLYERREEGLLGADEMGDILLNVESFLVRRLLVGVSTKNLNRIFIQMLGPLRDSDEPLIDAVRYQLSTERRFWASDEELRVAAASRPFYYYGRADQRRMILERIEESYGHKELAELSKLNLSVEHILPQSLSAAWINELTAAGGNAEEVHRELVHTLGNLTLSAYNSELSNLPFERKQQIYDTSKLSLNADLVSQVDNSNGSSLWGKEQILARAARIADTAIGIWPPPVPGVAEASAGFDWARMHAAITAIPDGQWTAYADLAALAGTAAQAVGNHLSDNPAVAKAYRVLTVDGRVSEGFRWPDPADDRNPQEVLEADGLQFNERGLADPAARLTADDLQSLLGWFDPDDDLLDDPEAAPSVAV